jgi:hypothetical protein
MKTSLFYALTVLTSLSFNSIAYAESGAHGGNVVSCTGQPLVVLDYYHAKLPTIGKASKLVDIEKMSTDEVINYFRTKFSNTAVKREFDLALRAIGNIDSWISTGGSTLRDVGDSNEAYFLPSSCKKLQAAARQGDTIYADSQIIAQLSEAQKGILVVHEALYYISEKLIQATTSEHVRTVIRSVLEEDSTSESIQKALLKIGATPYNFLVGKKFQTSRQEYCEYKFVSYDFVTKTLKNVFTYHQEGSDRTRYCEGLAASEWTCSQDGSSCQKNLVTLKILDSSSTSFEVLTDGNTESRIYTLSSKNK